MKIGETLREIRKSKELTQDEVCGKLKISQTFLSQIEGSKKEPSGKMLRALCKFYKVPYQVVIWQSIEEKDIQKNKLPMFRAAVPVMDALIKEYFN